jgi:hypothetical protein
MAMSSTTASTPSMSSHRAPPGMRHLPSANSAYPTADEGGMADDR